MRQFRWWCSILLAFLVLPLLPEAVFAQGMVLRGRVLDPEALPVAGITVSLHLVADNGGAEVGRAVSDREGWFEIGLEEGGGGGVYFAATRFEGTLYMGEPFRTLDEVTGEYRILIGTGGTTGDFTGGAAPQFPGEATDRRGPGIALILALLGIGAIMVPLVRLRRGPLALRSALVDLAELEEVHASRSAEARLAAEAEHAVLRERLRSRLRALSTVEAHAADLD
jgi:hypothetical protein